VAARTNVVHPVRIPAQVGNFLENPAQQSDDGTGYAAR
jgi:hypothetical protein